MVTGGAPARDEALRLIRERFLNRSDYVAILAPWGKPCPVEANGSLDALLLGHLFGSAAPEAHVKFANRRSIGAMTGRFRVGSYCPGPDDTTRWLCLDFDGAGHSGALVDPQAAVVSAYVAFDRAGLPAYLERSGGAKGWHLWCFFDPPLPAGEAQRIGRALAPKDARLTDGTIADPRSARGIEVFPKQPKIRRAGFGNLVWLPWWQGASAGGNVFHRPGTDGSLEPYTPIELATAPKEAVDRLLASLAPQVEPIIPPAHAAPAGTSPTSSTSSASTSLNEGVWGEWRRRALAALPLEAVYGEWLTGSAAGHGWLQCRDPSSPSGDQNPSASVADGTGEAERGAFHSFISGRTLSVFDFLSEQSGIDFREARARIAALSGVPEPSTPAPDDEPLPPGTPFPKAVPRKPRIVIRTAEHEVVSEAIAALARVDGVYCRSSLLVHVIRDASKLAGVIHPGGTSRILSLGAAGVREKLTVAADWVTLKERQGELEEVPAHPPAWAAPAVEARKSWPGLRHLEGVVETPVLRHDGTVLDGPGYDDATGLLYQPNARYPTIPSRPTIDDARGAASLLLDAVCDFPFKTEAHRAAWLAGVLTPLARFAFRGPSPLFLMDANVRGAGKSLLADVTGEIVSGRPMPRTPQALDETEEAKRITAIALEGDRLLLIDNISKPLGSGALDTVLTGTTWSERILGKSEKVSLPLLTVWYGTGNNVTFKGDTARRCLHIRLDSDLEKPEVRDGFKHPDLLAWVHAHRAELVVAALTILRGYCSAGRPPVGLKAWGSFEGWSALVRNALVWAGLPDPAETRAELDEVDTDANTLTDLIGGWEELEARIGRELGGCTIAQALEALRADEHEKQFARLRSALAELCPHPAGQLPTARRVRLRAAALSRPRRRRQEAPDPGLGRQQHLVRGTCRWRTRRGEGATSPDRASHRSALDRRPRPMNWRETKARLYVRAAERLRVAQN